MTEFRWLKYTENGGGLHPSGTFFSPPNNFIVLQYREVEDGPGSDPWWGEWKDIPIDE